MPPPARTWASGERLLFIVLLLGGALFLYLLAKPLLHGSVYAVGDLGFFHLPLRQFYADCLAQGDNFHWMPWLFCGYYVHGEGQVGMYHPLHLLLYGLLPLNWAFNFEFLLNFVFLPCGTYFWLRGWLPRRDGALLGAILFAFSGFTLGRNNHINAVAVIAHLPWLLLAFTQRHVQKLSSRIIAFASVQRDRRANRVGSAIVQVGSGVPQAPKGGRAPFPSGSPVLRLFSRLLCVGSAHHGQWVNPRPRVEGADDLKEGLGKGNYRALHIKRRFPPSFLYSCSLLPSLRSLSRLPNEQVPAGFSWICPLARGNSSSP